MRTIDANRLLEERRIHTYYHLPNGDIAIPLIDIKNAPTIEPERKTGRWIHDGYAFRGGIDWMHCSECGHKDSWSAATRTPFCAWCGARMEGEG